MLQWPAYRSASGKSSTTSGSSRGAASASRNVCGSQLGRLPDQSSRDVNRLDRASLVEQMRHQRRAVDAAAKQNAQRFGRWRVHGSQALPANKKIQITRPVEQWNWFRATHHQNSAKSFAARCPLPIFQQTVRYYRIRSGNLQAHANR